MENNILIAFTSVAVCMDLIWQKIDNRFIALGWILGFSFQMYRYQLKGIGFFFLGSAVPILLLYWLFWFRMLGAGDIKLLSVLGGFMGPRSVTICIGFSLFFGAVLSLAILILCGNFLARLKYFNEYLKHFIKTKQVRPYMIRGDRMENFHFSIPILLGVLLFTGGVY